MSFETISLTLDRERVKSLKKKGYNISQLVRNWLEDLDKKTDKSKKL